MFKITTLWQHLMNQDNTLVPQEQRTITFYDDEIPAVVVLEQSNQQTVYVPLRPICEYLGLSWRGQLARITRDPVLSEIGMSVIVTIPDIDPKSKRPHTSAMICLPLEYLNGWLFGISPDRVRADIRDKVIRYQKECYKVLAAAFLDRTPSADSSPNAAALIQIREMGRAIMTMAEEQLKFEARLTVHGQRLDKAAYAFADLTKRVSSIEQKLTPGNVVTEEQASQLSQAVKAIALELSKKSGRPEFGAVYGELYRRYGITGYKFLPANQFTDAINWLNHWFQELTDMSAEPF